MKLNQFIGINNKGDNCKLNGSCGLYNIDHKFNSCDPVKCLESRFRLINSTVGDN